MLQDILKHHYRLGTPRFEYDTLPKRKKKVGGSVFLSRTNHSYGTFFFFLVLMLPLGPSQRAIVEFFFLWTMLY